MSATSYMEIKDAIFNCIFLRRKAEYLAMPDNGIVNSLLDATTKECFAQEMTNRLKGMAQQSKRKYGIYNKAIDSNNPTALSTCFTWL